MPLLNEFLFKDEDGAPIIRRLLPCTDESTLVPSTDGTLKPTPSGTLVEIAADLGTMVINNDVDDQTMKSTLLSN